MAQCEKLSSEEESLIRGVFKNYVLEHHSDDIAQVIAEAEVHTHHAVVINAMNLFEANMEVRPLKHKGWDDSPNSGDYFNVYPSEVLALFDEVLQLTAQELSRAGQQRAAEIKSLCTLHARISGLPVCPELTRETIPRSKDVGHFLSVTGTVIRTSDAKVLEYQRDYMCAKCRHVFQISAEFDQFYTFVVPVACPNPERCESHRFSCLSGDTEPAACRDYQEIKIQEQVQRLSVGSIPRSMLVALEDDLVDCCKSGDDVTVYGVVCQRWKPFTENSRCDVELILKANHIEVNNQHTAVSVLLEEAHRDMEEFWDGYRLNPLTGRDQILLSFCPQIFGMYVVKLAVAMVMAGGVQRIDSTGGKVRGECHMLLVGDPGTGKSQFLKYAAKVMPRSVLTAGIGSTNAGLTVAAVKDGGDWHLEAGALVLSDGGLCCIDEFNSIKEHDRISIHEAMEQQSISVAKAGMVCKLNTRTTILAATNPKGQYDPSQSLSENVALASPLLSRFDLVLVLLDSRNAEWDRTISSFILEDRDRPGQPADSSSLWSIDKMKAYFCLIKRLQPQLSQDANRVLTSYYQLQRQSQGRNARTTIRMLESLSRLAEAHAKLMYRETVTIEDAIMAVSVMECSMQGGALLGSMNALLTSFPDDPVEQYRTQCQLLLEGLHLPQLLQKEMERLKPPGQLKMNVPSALNKELFVPCGEVLLVAVEVQRARSRYRSLLRNKRAASFLCVSVTKNKPQQLYITKVKQTGDSYIRRSQWTVEELRQVNGMNPIKDCPELELTFDNTVDQWVTRSAADKCIFVQVLYGACKSHLRGPSGGVVITPGTDEGLKKTSGSVGESPAPRSLRIRRKSMVPPKQTHFINCQPKLTRDAHRMNLVIYQCKALLNRVKSKVAAKQKQLKDQEHPGQSSEAGVMRTLVQRMSVALGRRKNKLRAAEDRTVELRQAAQRFAHRAQQLALRRMQSTGVDGR
ncbi:hypothetical protein WMY93_015630 [Mugilogobius chulae]|uniref:DNA helicase MCM9 n=1 Tax=Mugilogobius chulae TaxID=88201 RepID=A0AAW0NX36_9GOBI